MAGYFCTYETIAFMISRDKFNMQYKPWKSYESPSCSFLWYQYIYNGINQFKNKYTIGFFVICIVDNNKSNNKYFNIVHW